MGQYEAGEWPIDYSLAACSVFQDSGTYVLQQVAEEAAVNLLWNWTQHQFGSTEVTIRPQLKGARNRQSTWEGRGPLQMAPYGSTHWLPVTINGHVYSLRCGCGNQNCDCSPGRQYALAMPGKLQEVLSIQIETAELLPEEYRVVEDSIILVEGYWPVFQNMRLELGTAGTWGITYVKGLPVPLGGQLAAGVLSCELGKALVKDATCRLPERLQLLVSGGSGQSIKDTYGAYMSFGKTGLWVIDSWVDSVLTNREFASVRSVDLPGMR